MPTLREFQSAFGAAVRGASAAELGQVPENGIALERRMDVYRNNVYASLIDALESVYPVVERLVGAEFFRAMAREFLRSHLPTRGTLTGYGDAFPDFIENFEPVSTLSYLSDVARLELAWLAAYHSADQGPVDKDVLSSVSPEELTTLCFQFHPSVQFVVSDFPVWTIWHENNQEALPAAINLEAGGESACVLRHDRQIEVHLVDGAVREFGEGLMAGKPLGVACDVALANDPSFNWSAALHFFLSRGAFVRTHQAHDSGTKP